MVMAFLRAIALSALVIAVSFTSVAALQTTGVLSAARNAKVLSKRDDGARVVNADEDENAVTEGEQLEAVDDEA